MSQTLCIQALLALVAAGWPPSPEPKPKPTTLDGEWKAIAMIDNDGHNRTKDDMKDEELSCSIKGDKFVLRDRGEVREMTIKVNQKASPAEIDFVMPKGKGTLEAIFLLDDKGRLVISMNSNHWLPDRADEEPGRPKSFDPLAPANKGLAAVNTFTFQRKPKK